MCLGCKFSYREGERYKDVKFYEDLYVAQEIIIFVL